MKRPTSVKIIGKRHAVEYLPAGHADLVEGEDTFAGRIDHDRQKIVVEDGQTLASEQDTLLHEIMHGVERAMDLEVPETAIHRLATGILAVLKDNPSLGRYLMAKTLAT